jgi:hypothetical protein
VKIGDPSTDALAHRQEGAYGLLQKGLIGDELFHAAAEDITASLADTKAQVLQQTADFILEIALDLHQLGAAVQDSSDLMAGHALDLDLLIPAALHDPGQPDGIVAVILIDLHRQRRLGVTGIDANHRQAQLPKLVPQPGRGRARLETNALGLWSFGFDKFRDRLRLRDHRAFAQNLAAVVHHADRRLFERDVQANILFHSCSPVLSLHAIGPRRSSRYYGEPRHLSMGRDPIPELRHV